MSGLEFKCYAKDSFGKYFFLLPVMLASRAHTKAKGIVTSQSISLFVQRISQQENLSAKRYFSFCVAGGKHSYFICLNSQLGNCRERKKLGLLERGAHVCAPAFSL